MWTHLSSDLWATFPASELEVVGCSHLCSVQRAGIAPQPRYTVLALNAVPWVLHQHLGSLGVQTKTRLCLLQAAAGEQTSQMRTL
eukprot:165566-Chlamydomonas_euryale.AAC.6